MPPKRDKKAAVPEAQDALKPLPPNIFLYVLLANIDSLPTTIHPLEIHLDQGGSLIVKCEEHYKTHGTILQDEFYAKPTYTLIFQQDNLDRINHAADNPLLVKLYMRRSEPPPGEEEAEEEGTEAMNLLKDLMNQVEGETSNDEINYYNEKEELVLLSVGYLDIIKLFGHHRCMLREELFLYPVPDVPNELRVTVHTEWHLYTLVPIAKEVTFTNMAFVTFESIYNLKEDFILDVDTLNVQLSFRSVMPTGRNEYHTIPWCSFNNFKDTCIAKQPTSHIFEFFRNSVPENCGPGLKSNMEVQMHKLFYQLMRSELMEADFDGINTDEDNALVCNSFHRFILTNKMSDALYLALCCRRYLILVEVWQMATIEKKVGKKMVKEMGKQKVFEGILDPAIMLYPEVQTIRFAVELKYKGVKKKIPKPKRDTKMDRMTNQSIKTNRLSNPVEFEVATFAIIKLCLLAPLGQVYHELKVFRDSFISQNRLTYCKNPRIETKPVPLADLQKEAYARFDAFIRDTIRYIVDKNVHSVEEKRNHFCCTLQNLTNILLKVIGTDFNMRTHTTTNVEFQNLCSIAFNELELRVHNILEVIEDEGLDELITDRHEKTELIIDYMNAIKIMYCVGDKRMAKYLYEKECNKNFENIFDFYDLILKMERGQYASAKKFFTTSKFFGGLHEYFAGWIHIFLNFVETRDDPDPDTSVNANECLLNSIIQYAERFDCQQDGWILLYCYYKRFDYAPGYSYARWRMENQQKLQRYSTYSAPYSQWGISLNVFPVFPDKHGYAFFDSFKVFVRLGLYEFGQVIFDEVQYQCGDVERYMINTQLKVFLKQVDEYFEVQDFGHGNSEGEEESSDNSDLDAFNAQVNGNVEYLRGNWEKAAIYYEKNLDQPLTCVPGRDNFLLSKLRLAYLSYDSGNYEQTIAALNAVHLGKVMTLSCSYLMGKAYYKLEEYHKAMDCFINCTTYGTHVPDIWGFLALINLQMGNNLNAITCWKYAKIDPTKTVTDEIIFEELDMIDLDSVELYVDVPSPRNSTVSIANEE